MFLLRQVRTPRKLFVANQYLQIELNIEPEDKVSTTRLLRYDPFQQKNTS
jgi:hypothetical protein